MSRMSRMSRIRTIKPEFFIDEDIAKLSYPVRLAYIGLWCHADREGKLEDKPNQLKVQILPYDKSNFNDVLQALHDAGFIQRYSVDNRDLIIIPKFLEHQRPNAKEKESVIPNPLINIASTEETQSGISPREIQIFTEGKERKGKEGKELSLFVNKIVDIYVKFGNNLPQPRLDDENKLQSVSIAKDISKRLKVMGWQELFKAAVIHANKCPYAKGDNNRGWKVSLRWLVDSAKNVDKALDWSIEPKDDAPKDDTDLSKIVFEEE